MISSSILIRMSEKDILEGLSSEHVTKVIKISDSKPTFKLSFSKETPPSVLSICPGHYARVRPVYPLPVRLLKCQQFCHSCTTCRSKHVVCSRCGNASSETHDPHTCARDENCFHCKGSHQASSKSYSFMC